MIYFQLFLSFLQIGLFSIGGGYAAMPLIQAQVVTAHGWLTMEEFSHLVTISQMTPGPIAINGATFVGMQIAGFPGALAATLGCVAPSIVLVSVLAWVYYRYKTLSLLQRVLGCLRPAVVALIAAAGVSIFLEVMGSPSALNPVGIVLSLAGFAALRKWRLSPVLVMVVCGLLNLAWGLAV